MDTLNLDEHFARFVQEQIARGRFRDATEVVEAGLRLLEREEMNLEERREILKAEINAAWDEPGPSYSADEVFDSIEELHEEATRSQRA